MHESFQAAAANVFAAGPNDPADLSFEWLVDYIADMPAALIAPIKPLLHVACQYLDIEPPHPHHGLPSWLSSLSCLLWLGSNEAEFQA